MNNLKICLLLDETIEKINMILNTIYDFMDDEEIQLIEDAMNNVVAVKRELGVQ